VKRSEKYVRNPIWIVKWWGKYGKKMWNNMENRGKLW
jgi:hypothetical protein